MWKFLVAILFSVNIQAQHILANPNTRNHLSQEVKRWCQINFPDPPRKQPKIYIEYSPILPNIVGITRRLEDGSFIIDLNPLYSQIQLERTLIHELIHVHQIWNGDLKTLQTHWLWKGKQYPFNHQYRERPWERDARERTKIYCD